MLTPGFIDLTPTTTPNSWDPAASPSNLHGVTTIIGGNCGFTSLLAPGDGDYIRQMMAKVEGMPLVALGLDWDWETFEEYLSKLEGNLGVNAGFQGRPLCIAPTAMGSDAVGSDATPSSSRP
jgi:N-acyl-D-aspartate/D-glutamate deacylase